MFFPQHPGAEVEAQGRAACPEGAGGSVVCAQQLSLGFSVSQGEHIQLFWIQILDTCLQAKPL